MSGLVVLSLSFVVYDPGRTSTKKSCLRLLLPRPKIANFYLRCTLHSVPIEGITRIDLSRAFPECFKPLVERRTRELDTVTSPLNNGALGFQLALEQIANALKSRTVAT